jgi:aryl-alcohol dehydrogenase-like predicted oxidoreductase
MMERYCLASGYEISRVIRGGWQLAGGHGAIDRDAAVADLIAAADAGITTFDCADIYTGVEEIMGAFRHAYRNARGGEALKSIRVHTKCVPDLADLDRVTRSDVERIIDTSLRRLRIDRLDLVQFHWWDYDQPRWRDAAGWLVEFQEAGKIDRIGATNFNTAHIRELCGAGLPLTSLQLQYSLLDDRPAHAMAAAAGEYDFKLLCYGTVAGGFLSDRWLGRKEPREPLENRSLTKYKLIIDDRGGWDRFQALLHALRIVADRHDADIATVASRFVLDRPHVAAVIVGARNRAHLAANLAVSDLELTAEDRTGIGSAQADFLPLAGDVYDLERDRRGRHGAIMKYNLNAGAGQG